MIKKRGIVLVDSLIAVFITLAIVNLVYFALSSRVRINEMILTRKENINTEIINAFKNNYNCELCIKIKE